MGEQDCGQLTLFPGDSPASRSVSPGSGEAVRMTVTSGRRCSELYRKSGPLGLLVRTLLASSQWRSTRCLLTWKASATPAKRLLFRLAPWTPRTEGTDARLSDGAERWKAKITGADGQPVLWKTPTASNAARNNRDEPNLSDMVKLWPTPTTRDYKGANSIKHLTRFGSGHNHIDQLPNAVMTCPTPQAREDEGRNMAQGNGGQLNPDWVEWLMGFPIGWTSL